MACPECRAPSPVVVPKRSLQLECDRCSAVWNSFSGAVVVAGVETDARLQGPLAAELPQSGAIVELRADKA